VKPTWRHLIGGGAAACAVCCTAPLLALPVLAGVGATVAAFLCSGAFLAVFVALVAVLAVTRHRRQSRDASCAPADGTVDGPVDVELTTGSHRLGSEQLSRTGVARHTPRPRTERAGYP
jgi:hypothetical protein